MTEEYNSNQRIRDRLNVLKKTNAANRARGGGSGIDIFSGSSINVEQGNVGETTSSNFEDIFNTDNTVGKINEAGKNRAAATRLRGLTSLVKAATTKKSGG